MKINWIPVSERLPQQLADGFYEPVFFVTVEHCPGVREVIHSSENLSFDVEYGGDKNPVAKFLIFDSDAFPKNDDQWFDLEEHLECKVVAWSSDEPEEYKG